MAFCAVLFGVIASLFQPSTLNEAAAVGTPGSWFLACSTLAPLSLSTRRMTTAALDFYMGLARMPPRAQRAGTSCNRVRSTWPPILFHRKAHACGASNKTVYIPATACQLGHGGCIKKSDAFYCLLLLRVSSEWGVCWTRCRINLRR